MKVHANDYLNLKFINLYIYLKSMYLQYLLTDVSILHRLKSYKIKATHRTESGEIENTKHTYTHRMQMT